ncbi:DNA excision repair protein ERCC-1 isoform X1 [Plodia interpunctella]|uniref:DNA excision repair protein ERCC-1 isoform X1 n=1 Tax=Plodia interpunctella TaxID=58824 RepID=UPI00236800C7|nr:DNA excision repair protein ERCC-1 isoform X1 [Plodia interpunctella]
MELDDGLDDLLAEICEPTSPKQIKLDPESMPGTSKDIPSKPTVSKTHCVLVNQKQRGNPLLKFITSVPWEYDDIIPDYEVGKTICILFLSLRYHNLNPDYINNRLKELGKKYELRVLLVQVDLKDPHLPLKNLNRICLLTDMTLMLAWSPEEAAKVIENYKIYENKPPDRIMEKIENDPHQKIINALSSIKPVNKTDAMTLIKQFGTLENIIKASERRLAEIPGFGATKAKKLYKALHEPFLKRPNIKDEEFSEDLNLEEVESIEKEVTQ